MISKTNCNDTMWNLNWVVISSEKNWRYNSTFWSVSSDRHHQDDLLTISWGWSEHTDRNVELYPQFFLELITTQLRFHMVSPQIVLLIILTMQSYKFYLSLLMCHWNTIKILNGMIEVFASKVVRVSIHQHLVHEYIHTEECCKT